MNKKAQVTIFIIIAVVIVALVALFFMFKDKIIKSGSSKLNVDEINNFVEQCIQETGEDTIFTVGQGGGYYFPPTISTDSGVTYYYLDEKNYMPSKKRIQGEISHYEKEKLLLCTGNFLDFPEYEIKQGEIKTETEILKNKIILNIKYPLAIKKGNETSNIENFKVEIPVRFGTVYDAVEKIMQEQSNHSDSICLSCLNDASTENDLYVDMLDYNNETTIFIFTDDNSKLNNESFQFIFANEYKTQ